MARTCLRPATARMIEIRRHQMGMVFQHFALLPHLRRCWPMSRSRSRSKGFDRPEREARARKMIELVGLAGKEDAFPRELSGGQQQRVGIARSLSVEPELWFLDEPFSALDPLIRREMQDEFMRLQSVLSKTIVFITHDFDEAIRLADRIAIMKDGAIVQSGTPEEIVLNPATAYVAEFTRNVSKAKVVKVQSIMKPAGIGLNGSAIHCAGHSCRGRAAVRHGVDVAARRWMPKADPLGALHRARRGRTDDAQVEMSTAPAPTIGAASSRLPSDGPRDRQGTARWLGRSRLLPSWIVWQFGESVCRPGPSTIRSR